MTDIRAGVLVATRVLLVSARMQISQTASAPTTVVFGFIQPLVLVLVTLLPLHDPQPQRVSRILVGVLLTAFWTATVWGASGVLRRDRAWGTLARSLCGVGDARLVVIGKGLGASALSVVFVGATVTAGVLVLRPPVVLAHPGWAAAGLLIVVASGAAAGLLIGSVFVLTRYGPHISSALMYPVFLVGGMIIPLGYVPAGLRWLSYGISLRWLQEFLASAATGAVNLPALAAGTGLTVLYGLLGALVFQRIVTRARRDASLDLV